MEGKELSLKDIKKVWCLFEQSGTFRDAFKRRGIEAVDVDRESKHGNPEHVLDLFTEIRLASVCGPSFLNGIQKDHLCFAFFPCTYFTDQSQLTSRGDGFNQRALSMEKKLRNSADDMYNRADFYNCLCQLVIWAIKKEVPLIIENPYGRPGFLTQYFPLRPGLVLFDRTKWGDYYRKPTQFFFVGFRPKFWVCEPNDMRVTQKIISKMERLDGKRIEDVGGFDRSRISPLFADNFIENVFWS